MNINDLKSGEPFFREWYIDSYSGTTQFESAFKIYREQGDQHEYGIMKVIKIPRDKKNEYDFLDESDVESEAHYYREIVTDIYREICLLENLQNQQHIVTYEGHTILRRRNSVGYDIYIRTEWLENFCDSMNATFMTYQDVIQLGKNICEALDVCERYHIIHGNIRPDCIYLSEHGQYKLGGFTFPCFSRQKNADQSHCQENEYTAPEMKVGERFDSRADIYSLGLLLYCCLNNNQLPSNLTSIPLPISASKEFGKVILKACAQDPINRYQTAREFQDALIAISVFLGENIMDKVNPSDMEEAELYVAATQEDCVASDELLLQEQANKQLQMDLQQELQQEIQEEMAQQQESRQKKQEKDVVEVSQEVLKGNTDPCPKEIRKIDPEQILPSVQRSLASNMRLMKEQKKRTVRKKTDRIKKTKNMGPWILGIWISVLTIAVIVLLFKSDLGLGSGTETKETIQTAQSTPEPSKDGDGASKEEIGPTQPILITDAIPENPPSNNDQNEEDSTTIILSEKGLESLDEVGEMDKVTIMVLSNNSISDLSLLCTANKIETLQLNRNMISDIEPLSKLKTLKELDLSDNRITSVSQLTGLTNLEVLSLSNNLLTDVSGIEELTKLSTLYLDGNSISDVSNLATLTNLIFLNLSNNKLNEKDILELQKALPNCIINY